MDAYIDDVQAAQTSARADLFRVLGDEDRLRLLALCAAEELTVGELATLTGESQPQVTRKSQPLREAGLLVARKDGTRTLLRAETEVALDPVVRAALEAGRALCEKDGSLAEVPALVAQREETSRRLFARDASAGGPIVGDGTSIGGAQLLPLLPMLAPLLPGRALAVDVGAGEGALLPLLSPLYERVVAVDRSAARLARCAELVSALGLPNVRLREGAVEDAGIVEEIARAGGADLVVVSRVLHHVARPPDVLAAAARLLRAGGGGHLVVVDHVPHEDERLRERGHVWLGFEPGKLRGWLEAAGLEVAHAAPLRAGRDEAPPLQLAVGRAPGPRLELIRHK